MQTPTRVRVTIATDTELLSVIDLSTYLHHFRAAYVVCLRELETSSSDEMLTPSASTSLAQKALSSHKDLVGQDLDALARASLPTDHDLLLADIRRENPLDIIFICIAAAVAGAAIISGGKFKGTKDGIEVELPPIGEGIAEIKKAFRDDKPPKVPPPKDPKA